MKGLNQSIDSSKKMINIVTAADARYVEQVSVMLLSASVNTDSSIAAFVLYSEFSAAQKSLIVQALPSNISVSFIDCSSLSGSIPVVSKETNCRISPVTYYRIFLEDLLECERLLYLDADIVVTSTLDSIWSMDLKEHALACVVDGPLIDRNREFGVSGADYFNAGVMLLDSARWREKCVLKNALNYGKNASADALVFNDQDCLNAVLADSALLLGKQANYQTIAAVEDQAAGQLCEDPILVHYTGADKPWYVHSMHPFREEYRRWRLLTPFKNAPLELFLDDWDRAALDALSALKGEICLYGAGERGRRIYHAIKKDRPELRVRAFVDKNNRLEAYDGVPVLKQLPDVSGNVLITTAAYASEVADSIARNQPRYEIYAGKWAE